MAMAAGTRERFIATTAKLLLFRGYYGTSLGDIIEGSGAPRGSLYFHFPGGKDELVLAATRAGADQATRALSAALAGAPNPAAGVRAYAEAAARLMRESDYTFGCPLAPVVLDADGGFPALAELCRATFAVWTGILRDAFAAAGMAGRRAGALATIVVTTIEGALLMARSYRDAAPLETAAAELEAMVAAALPARGRRREANRRGKALSAGRGTRAGR